MNVEHYRCATLNPQAVFCLVRNRDNVITKRCQNPHSIIESKLKVQFSNCVAKINLWLALTINCCVRKKLTEFISDAFVHHLLKLGENWPWDDSGLVLWHIRRKRKYLLFNVWTVWDIKHMNMATSLIQRHKLKIKTQSTKNLSASIQQTKCSDCLQRLVSWDGCRAHPALSYSSNIDCWNDQISRNIPEKDRRGVTISWEYQNMLKEVFNSPNCNNLQLINYHC